MLTKEFVAVCQAAMIMGATLLIAIFAATSNQIDLLRAEATLFSGRILPPSGGSWPEGLVMNRTAADVWRELSVLRVWDPRLTANVVVGIVLFGAAFAFTSTLFSQDDELGVSGPMLIMCGGLAIFGFGVLFSFMFLTEMDKWIPNALVVLLIGCAFSCLAGFYQLHRVHRRKSRTNQ